MGESQGFVAQAVVVKEFCRREPLYPRGQPALFHRRQFIPS